MTAPKWNLQCNPTRIILPGKGGGETQHHKPVDFCNLSLFICFSFSSEFQPVIDAIILLTVQPPGPGPGPAPVRPRPGPAPAWPRPGPAPVRPRSRPRSGPGPGPGSGPGPVWPAPVRPRIPTGNRSGSGGIRGGEWWNDKIYVNVWFSDEQSQTNFYPPYLGPNIATSLQAELLIFRVDSLSLMKHGMITNGYPYTKSPYYKPPFCLTFKTIHSVDSDFLTFNHFLIPISYARILRLLTFDDDSDKLIPEFKSDLYLPCLNSSSLNSVLEFWNIWRRKRTRPIHGLKSALHKYRSFSIKNVILSDTHMITSWGLNYSPEEVHVENSYNVYTDGEFRIKLPERDWIAVYTQNVLDQGKLFSLDKKIVFVLPPTPKKWLT